MNDKSRYGIGIYLLPSLITTVALCVGFLAMLAAIQGDLPSACAMTLISVVLDGLDGRIARMTGTASRFGAAYDSLSDAVAFGCAPATLAFLWLTENLAVGMPGKIAYIAVLFYVATAVLRLARFNVRKGKKYLFRGLPSPAAAAFIVSLIWTCDEAGFYGPLAAWLAIAALFLSGGCMVSAFGYYSGKDINLGQRVPVAVLATALVVFALAATDAPLVVLMASTVYLASGPALYALRAVYKRIGFARRGRLR